MSTSSATQPTRTQYKPTTEQAARTPTATSDAECPAYIKIKNSLNHRTPAIYSTATIAESQAKSVRTALADTWSDFLLKNGPYLVMLTITFKSIPYDLSVFSAVNHIVFSLNRKLFGKKFEQHSQFLHGFAVAEQHELGFNRGDLHLHLLIKEFDGVTVKTVKHRLRVVLAKILPSVRTPISKREMTSLPNVDITIVTDQRGTCDYVTKGVGKPGNSIGDQVGELTARGVSHLVLESDRKRLIG